MNSQVVTVQIDPSHVVCWEDGRTLRIGFDPVIMRFAELNAEEARLLSSLIAGISDAQLEQQLSDAASATATTMRRFHEIVEQLRPVLTRSSLPRNTRRNSAERSAARHQPVTSIRAVISDDGRAVPELRAALESEWLCRFERDNAPPELAIQVIRFLEPLERTRRWLCDGVPCLLVRFTNEAVRVGPLVATTGAPCHTCEVLSIVHGDPALPRLAARLYGSLPGSERPAVAQIAAAVAANMVTAWRDGARWVHDTQVTLPVSRGVVTGLPSIAQIAAHEECGCALSDESPPQQRTSTELATHA